MIGQPVYITGTAAFLPNAPIDNERMEAVLGQVGERPSRARRTILRSNGIVARYYAIDPQTRRRTHTNAQMTAAAVAALGDLGDLDCLACGTSTPDQLMPNHAVMVQGELGLARLEAVATSGICMSGVMALKYAFMSIACGVHKCAVATGSDLASPMLDARNFMSEIEAKVEALEKSPGLAFEKDFLRWMLSDGAGAVKLADKPSAGQINLRVDWIETFSYAGEIEACMYAGAIKAEDGMLVGWTQIETEIRDQNSVMSIKQDVRLLNDNIVNFAVEKPIPLLARKHGLTPAEIDYFLPHYSSEYFRDLVHEGMIRIGFEVPQARWFSNLKSKGNTGAASIFIILDELRASGVLCQGQRLLCFVPESGRFSAGYIHLTVV